MSIFSLFDLFSAINSFNLLFTTLIEWPFFMGLLEFYMLSVALNLLLRGNILIPIVLKFKHTLDYRWNFFCNTIKGLLTCYGFIYLLLRNFKKCGQKSRLLD